MTTQQRLSADRTVVRLIKRANEIAAPLPRSIATVANLDSAYSGFMLCLQLVLDDPETMGMLAREAISGDPSTIAEALSVESADILREWRSQ